MDTEILSLDNTKEESIDDIDLLLAEEEDSSDAVQFPSTAKPNGSILFINNKRKFDTDKELPDEDTSPKERKRLRKTSEIYATNNNNLRLSTSSQITTSSILDTSTSFFPQTPTKQDSSHSNQNVVTDCYLFIEKLYSNYCTLFETAQDNNLISTEQQQERSQIEQLKKDLYSNYFPSNLLNTTPQQNQSYSTQHQQDEVIDISDEEEEGIIELNDDDVDYGNNNYTTVVEEDDVSTKFFDLEQKVKQQQPTEDFDSSFQESSEEIYSAYTNYDRSNFPWSQKVKERMREYFKVDTFRENQQQAVNAFLAKQDVFIVMPTGHGKSLCYQLPAICSKGVTIVISPLQSLITDQVQQLVSKGIGASFLANASKKSHNDKLEKDLRSSKPFCKVLYLTPEKLNKSNSTQSLLKHLYSRGLLSAIVVDEAHCISSWGFDFRKDYLALSNLKDWFPNSPIMALTATASERVKNDITTQLKIYNAVQLQCSFNRPNLFYEVRHKSGKVIEDIVSFIKEKHPNDCGIVYCLSKSDCQKVSDELASVGHLSTAVYFSSASGKEANQMAWSSGNVKIIVATTAFGMGINKADVRFVIHHSLPQSIENYYQESGRAGRDGKPSDCILYYNYSDKKRILNLMSLESGSVTSVQQEKLEEMIRYCEEKVECRRVMQLKLFDEVFDRSNCHKNCDNCLKGEETNEEDVSGFALSLLQCVKEVSTKKKTTLKFCVEVWCGANTKALKDGKFDQLRTYGKGKDFGSKAEAETLGRKLITLGYITETTVRNLHGQYVIVYADFSKMKLLENKKATVLLQRKLKSKKEKSKDGKEAKDASSTSTPKSDPSCSKTNTPKKDLLAHLYEYRKRESDRLGKIQNQLIGTRCLENIAKSEPKSLKDLSSIELITPTTIEKIGLDVLKISREYCSKVHKNCDPIADAEAKQISKAIQERNFKFVYQGGATSSSSAKDDTKIGGYETFDDLLLEENLFQSPAKPVSSSKAKLKSFVDLTTDE